MISPTIPPDVTPGERRVCDAPAALPDEYPVCYRRPFPGRHKLRISRMDGKGGAA